MHYKGLGYIVGDLEVLGFRLNLTYDLSQKHRF